MTFILGFFLLHQQPTAISGLCSLVLAKCVFPRSLAGFLDVSLLLFLKFVVVCVCHRGEKMVLYWIMLRNLDLVSGNLSSF